MFEDPLFDDTNIRSVRRIVPWDVVTRGVTPRTEAMGYADCRNGSTPTQKVDGIDVAIRGDQTSGNDRSDLDVLRDWITEADNAGMEIMVSFEHSRPSGSYCYLPTRPQYRAAVRAFRDEFPEVDLYTSWNEPNHKTQPTHPRWYPGKRGSRETYIGARQAGRFWLDMKKECQREDGDIGLRKCSVAAGDLLDDATFSPKAFRVSEGGSIFRNYVEGLNGQEPTVWAWHAYSAGYRGKNRDGEDLPRSSERLQRFMEATDYISKTPPRVWLTEQGGRYDLHRNPDFDGLRAADAEAAADADLDYLFTLPFKSFAESRISRMYIYHWISGPEQLAAPRVEDRHPFDAGLLEANSPDRGPRSLYFTFKDMVTGTAGSTTQP